MVESIERFDQAFARLQDAVADVMVARDSVADIFLEEFARGAFSDALRLRVRELLDARDRLDEAVREYGEYHELRN